MDSKLIRWDGDQVVTGDEVIDGGTVIFDDEKIIWVGQTQELPERFQQLTAQLQTKKILPGLIDVHCHGGGGASFPDAQELEQVKIAADEHLKHGTTTLVASLVTADIDTLVERTHLLVDACKKGYVYGIHYEGPFLSEARCGAQDPRFLIDISTETAAKLVDASAGWAVTMTVAPERLDSAQAREGLQMLVDNGVLPSWGHTNAAASEAAAAIDWGVHHVKCRGKKASVTHLFNGMKPLHHRDPGSVGEFLAAGARSELFLEMISDAVHLDPSLVANVADFAGAQNCLLVTDAMAAAGMPDGIYQLGPQKVRMEGGVARLAEGDSLAGGTSHLLDCVRVCVQKAGIDLLRAVQMATVNPARFLGITDRGRIAEQTRADLIAVDEDLRIQSVVRAKDFHGAA